MAKKKNKGGGGAVLIIIIFIVIVVCTPIALFFGFLYYRFAVSEIISKLKHNYSDFWLSNEEKEEFKTAVNNYIQIKGIVNNAWKAVEENNISINKDGSISKRSKLGKKLRTIVEQYEPELFELEEKLLDLQSLPQKRWIKFNNLLRRFLSCKIVFIIWIVLFIVVGLIFGYSPIGVFKAYYKCLMIPFDQPAWKKNEFLILIIITAGTWISFLLVYFGRYKTIAENFSPYPPEVSPENVDKF